MTKSLVVLAVPHQLQGPGFQNYVPDPSYEPLVRRLIERGKIDFVFEEAAGREPSIAKNLARPGHYLDVAPPNELRKIAEMSASARLKPLSISCESTIIEIQEQREQEWKQRIETQPFENGLLICGLCHNLSIAFRLLSAGIRVDRTYSYIPRIDLEAAPPNW